MSTQTWLRDVAHMLDRMGVQHRLEYGSRHAKVYVSKGDRKGLVVISMSPSDRKSLLVVRTKVRHVLGLVSDAKAG